MARALVNRVQRLEWEQDQAFLKSLEVAGFWEQLTDAELEQLSTTREREARQWARNRLAELVQESIERV